MMADTLLLADVGGTYSRIGLAHDRTLDQTSMRTIRNADFSGLAAVLKAYLDALQPNPPRAFCAGVAGPVRAGAAQLTNLDWFLDPCVLSRETGISEVSLINDLQAQGYALDDLAPATVTLLVKGARAGPDAVRMVFGMGTGCNIAVVHKTPGGLFVPPAESGHSSLPFVTGKLRHLFEHLGRDAPHLPIEAVLSGPGLGRIYTWMSGENRTPSEIIAAHEDGNALAYEALQFFGQVLGQTLGNLALNHLPMGGVYLIGGLARAIAPHLDRIGFLENFTARGPYQNILQDIPVYLIDDDNTALRGCARYMWQQLD